MSSNTTQVVTGSFVSTGNPINIVIPSGVNWFELLDTTAATAVAGGSAAALVSARWSSDMAAGAAYWESGTVTTGALVPHFTTTNGFTPFYYGGPQQAGAIHTGTAITHANPAVASSATTVPVGSIVRITNPLLMEQISGWDFTVTASTPSTNFTLGYLDSSGFATDSGAFSFSVINPDWAWYPRVRLITKITQASQAVITFSVTHNFVVGQLIRIKVPAAFGMPQINGLVGQITAVSTANNTITVNINSTGFTAFAFPTSAIAAAGDQFPQGVAIGEFPQSTNLAAFDNQGTQGLTLGTNVCGAASDQMYWVAYSGVPIS
jgi:hypothetical protein